MTSADTGFEMIRNIVSNTSFANEGFSYVIILIAVQVCCILISPRKPSNLKSLNFPIMIAFIAIGFKIPTLFLGLAGLVFIVETLTVKGVGDIIEAVGTRVREAVQIPTDIMDKRREGREKRVRDIKTERRLLGLEKKGYIAPRANAKYGEGVRISDLVEVTKRKRKSRTSVGEYVRKAFEDEKRNKIEVDE